MRRILFFMFLAGMWPVLASSNEPDPTVQIESDLTTLVRFDDATKQMVEKVSGYRERRIYFSEQSGDPEFATLAAVPWVSKVYLVGTRITDLTPLTGLSNLVEFAANRVVTSNTNWRLDLQPLAQHRSLQRLSLGGVTVTNAQVLSELPNLVHLRLHTVGNVRLEGVARMRDLQFLGVTACPGNFSLAPLRGLPKLQSVTLNMLQVSSNEYAVLRTLPALAAAELHRAPLADLRVLADCATLQWLRIWHAKSMVSLAGVEGLSRLVELDIASARVTDLSPLAGCAALRKIALREAPVTDVAPLTNLTGLTSLDLRGTGVTNAVLLGVLPHLQKLSLPAHCSPQEITALKAALPKCRVNQQ
jgi:Leucine-rich repeat (LRR) protein